jgi:DnaJ-class molecular chaperone
MSSDNIICDVCNGSGIIMRKKYMLAYDYCDKCKGVGVVNWIENIFFKQYPLTPDEYHIRVRNMDSYPKLKSVEVN